MTLSLEKESIVLVKSLEMVLNLGSQNVCKPCKSKNWLDILGVRFFGRIQRRICDLVWILRQQKAENAKKDHLPWQRHVLMLLAMTRKEGKKQQTDPRDKDKKEKQQAWSTHKYTKCIYFGLKQTFLAEKTP